MHTSSAVIDSRPLRFGWGALCDVWFSLKDRPSREVQVPF